MHLRCTWDGWRGNLGWGEIPEWDCRTDLCGGWSVTLLNKFLANLWPVRGCNPTLVQTNSRMLCCLFRQGATFGSHGLDYIIAISDASLQLFANHLSGTTPPRWPTAVSPRATHWIPTVRSAVEPLPHCLYIYAVMPRVLSVSRCAMQVTWQSQLTL